MTSSDELLQKLLSNGILSAEDVATQIDNMNIEDVKKVHHLAIFSRKSGRVATNVKVSGRYTAEIILQPKPRRSKKAIMNGRSFLLAQS